MKCSKDYKYKSGHQKRRQKELEEIANAASHPKQEKLDKFFQTSSSEAQSQQHSEDHTETLSIVSHPDTNIEDEMMIQDEIMTSPCLQEGVLQQELQQAREKSVESEENSLTQEVQGAGRRFERLHETTSLNERLQLANISGKQPNYASADLPFDPGRVYQRQISEVSGNRCINRQWVTIDVKDRKVIGVYCKICLAFATCDSAFTNGFTKFTHIYQRIEEHETSKSHNSSVTAYFNAQSGNDIESLVNTDMRNLRRKHICENIDVLKRILDVIKYLGTQALPYRSHRGESLFTLEDRTINHGNFLELILFLAQDDTPLHMHVTKAIETSKKRKESLENRGKEKS